MFVCLGLSRMVCLSVMVLILTRFFIGLLRGCYVRFGGCFDGFYCWCGGGGWYDVRYGVFLVLHFVLFGGVCACCACFGARLA